jgi:hypothetical protein
MANAINRMYPDTKARPTGPVGSKILRGEKG